MTTTPEADTLFVRVVLADDIDRDAFENWYAREHFPKAFRTFDAVRASRWLTDGETEGPVYYAVYEMESSEHLERVLAGDGLRSLVEEFGRIWGRNTLRYRSRGVCVQALGRS